MLRGNRPRRPERGVLGAETREGALLVGDAGGELGLRQIRRCGGELKGQIWKLA
jgi:hypothetical protein